MGTRLYSSPSGDEDGTKFWYRWVWIQGCGWICFTGMGMG